jgi:hypothetical protein
LPEGFVYAEDEMTSAVREKTWAKHDYTVHTVCTQQWPIARMRKEVEKLKSVPGLTSIWIEKNGRMVATVTGTPTDSWIKEGGRWIKE